MDDIEVEYLASRIDDNTVLVSSYEDLGAEWFDKHADEILKSAMETYPTAGQNSVIIPNLWLKILMKKSSGWFRKHTKRRKRSCVNMMTSSC